MIDFIPGLSKEIRLADVPLDFLGRDGNHLEVLSRIQRSLKAAAGTVINTVYELEADFVDALSAQGLCMYTIGPMAATDWEGNFNKMPSLIPEDEGCLRWLDGQPRGAVVYVALGSLVSLTEEEIGEVALGLEACEQPFLWVLRRSPTAGFDPRTVLPAGFQERMKERGCVITWAPQAAVLAHASIGCYLSHCGMGSVLEALWAGVPIIGGFSKMSDHNTNMWLVTKLWRVGMALRGGRDVGHPPPIRRDIEMRVREMIHGEEGKAISQNVVRMKAVVRKAVESSGSSHRSLSKLVEQMQAHIL
ncbi:hypothetical protein L7F22_051990 [Adiantum nelumboides]|nr:hypothetical protein [Adiantum nelumboides]